MSEYETTLSGAPYGLRRVFLFIWRWRTLPPHEEAAGLAWGRRGAMRAARTRLRNRKPAPARAETAAATALPSPAQPKAIPDVRSPLYPGVGRPGGGRLNGPAEPDASFAPRPDHTPHLRH